MIQNEVNHGNDDDDDGRQFSMDLSPAPRILGLPWLLTSAALQADLWRQSS